MRWRVHTICAASLPGSANRADSSTTNRDGSLGALADSDSDQRPYGAADASAPAGPVSGTTLAWLSDRPSTVVSAAVRLPVVTSTSFATRAARLRPPRSPIASGRRAGPATHRRPRWEVAHDAIIGRVPVMLEDPRIAREPRCGELPYHVCPCCCPRVAATVERWWHPPTAGSSPRTAVRRCGAERASDRRSSGLSRSWLLVRPAGGRGLRRPQRPLVRRPRSEPLRTRPTTRPARLPPPSRCRPLPPRPSRRPRCRRPCMRRPRQRGRPAAWLPPKQPVRTCGTPGAMTTGHGRSSPRPPLRSIHCSGRCGAQRSTTKAVPRCRRTPIGARSRTRQQPGSSPSSEGRPSAIDPPGSTSSGARPWPHSCPSRQLQSVRSVWSVRSVRSVWFLPERPRCRQTAWAQSAHRKPRPLPRRPDRDGRRARPCVVRPDRREPPQPAGNHPFRPPQRPLHRPPVSLALAMAGWLSTPRSRG